MEGLHLLIHHRGVTLSISWRIPVGGRAVRRAKTHLSHKSGSCSAAWMLLCARNCMLFTSSMAWCWLHVVLSRWADADRPCQAVPDGEAPGGGGGNLRGLELLHAAAGAQPDAHPCCCISALLQLLPMLSGLLLCCAIHAITRMPGLVLVGMCILLLLSCESNTLIVGRLVSRSISRAVVSTGMQDEGVRVIVLPLT